MKKYILEYYAGDPDTMSEYDDSTNKYIRSWHYDSSIGISFGWFQTTLDGGKEFIFGEDTCHYDLTQEIGSKILGKAVNCKDFDDDDLRSIGYAVNDTSAFKGRTFDVPRVVTTWHKVSSEKLYEILEKIGGIEKFQNYEYVYPKEYGYGGNEEVEAGHMNVIDYINSHDQYVSPSDIKRMTMDIKGSYSFPDWMVDIVREYNKPNSTLAAKTAKLGNMTIAQYNSLIHQEGKESKKTINEYYEGTPDVVYNSDNDETIRWQDGAICFGFFRTSLDGDYSLLCGNYNHYKIANDAAKIFVGKALNHINDSYVDGWITNKCYDLSYGLGRYWKEHEIIAFWYSPSDTVVIEVIKKLNLNPDIVKLVTDEQFYNNNLTLSQYLLYYQGGGDDGEEEKSEEFKIDPKIAEKIRSYNKPADTWQSQKEKKGWKTLAQRNATIYQEQKKPKDTIKENNMKENKYQKEFSNYIEIMNEALKRNDFKAYNVAKSMLEETIEDSKQEEALLAEMNTNNFGILNHIFEQQLTTLIKSNKKAVKNVIKTIKEDKNLLGQFNFYNVIKTKYKGETANLVESKEALEKLAEISVNDIDQKTVKESNKKLRKVMLENNVIPTDFVDEENKKLYESGHVILTRKKTTANMIPLIESYHNVCQYMENHKNDAVKVGKNPDELIREFEEKLKNNLNESEISFVQQITDFRTPIAEQRKEKLFNKFKNECLEKINAMLKEDAENSGLIDLSNQINEMVFDKNNIVKDIAKLLEIRDILMDD